MSLANEVFTNASHRICSYHLIHQNIARHFGATAGAEAKTLFYRLVYARSEEEFNRVYKLLKVKNLKAWEYMETIPRDHYAQYTFTEKTTTRNRNASQAVESWNNAILKERSSVNAVDYLYKCLKHQRETVSMILQECKTNLLSNKREENNLLIPRVAKLFAEQWKAAGSLSVEEAANSTTQYTVTGTYKTREGTESQLAFNVSVLLKDSCSCGLSKITDMPCEHFTAAFQKHHGTVNNEAFYKEAFYSMYGCKEVLLSTMMQSIGDLNVWVPAPLHEYGKFRSNILLSNRAGSRKTGEARMQSISENIRDAANKKQKQASSTS